MLSFQTTDDATLVGQNLPASRKSGAPTLSEGHCDHRLDCGDHLGSPVSVPRCSGGGDYARSSPHRRRGNLLLLPQRGRCNPMEEDSPDINAAAIPATTKPSLLRCRRAFARVFHAESLRTRTRQGFRDRPATSTRQLPVSRGAPTQVSTFSRHFSDQKISLFYLLWP